MQLVLVSHRAKFIYFKTFKTAGTSVEMGLEPACRPPGSTGFGTYYNGPAGIVAQRGQGQSGNPFRSHADARLVQRQVGLETWAAYTKIAVVRDPYEKAVSMFWHQHARHGLIAEPTNAECAIESFQRWIIGGARLPRDDRRVAIHGEVFLDVCLRHEALDADFSELCRKLGIEARPLPRFHGELKTLKTDHRLYYDSATANLVAEHYALDFDAFGYDIDAWKRQAPPHHGRDAA